jgi:hypothetical protein
MSSRGLEGWEKTMASFVFGTTIPYDKVHISGGSGAGGRPFTVPDVSKPGHFIIYLGSQWFWRQIMNKEKVLSVEQSPTYKATLIHELSHVWQGHNSRFAWGYTLNSVWWQAHKGGGAYRYTDWKWKNWKDYNVEQQAQIVEDWFHNGASDTDPRYRYIRDHILKP